MAQMSSSSISTPTTPPHNHPPSPLLFGLLFTTSVFFLNFIVGLLAYHSKDIVFRFIIEYSSTLRDFGPLGDNNNNNNRSIFIGGFLKDYILACVET
jgi:hypothetical protein